MPHVKRILGPRKIPFGQNLKIGETLVEEDKEIPNTVFAKMVNGGFIMDYDGEQFIVSSIEEATDTIKKWFEMNQDKIQKDRK